VSKQSTARAIELLCS